MDGIEESAQGLAKMGSSLEALLGDRGRADAIMESLKELLDYAQSEDCANALDAESEAIRVSRQVVRRLFEQKRQG